MCATHTCHPHTCHLARALARVRVPCERPLALLVRMAEVGERTANVAGVIEDAFAQNHVSAAMSTYFDLLMAQCF